MTLGALLFVRYVKLLAVLALAGGTTGAFVPRALSERRWCAYAIAAPGFAVVWGTGLAMALGTGVSPVTPWIAGAAIGSTIAMNVVLWSVARDGRRTWAAAATSVFGLAIALALMVWKPVMS